MKFPPADHREVLLHKLFTWGITIKAIDGVLETIGGVLVLLIRPRAISVFLRIITEHELDRDPRDFVASHLLSFGAHLSVGVKLFGAIYLLAHGFMKIVMVAALMRDRLWAYPFSLVVLNLFVVYQLYRIFFIRPAPFLILLTIFDLCIIALVWHEWNYHHRRLKKERE